MKALIFGSNGQDGIFLNKLLLYKKIEVKNISRNNADYLGSVSDYNFVESIIKSSKPDFIFHFAANSTTKHDVLFENHETICTGTLNILEAAKLFSPRSKIFLSGSAMQFKNIGEPIHEDTEFIANSPYSISRIQSVYAGRYYRNTFGLQVYVGYFFNHDSELRSEKHVNQKIATAVKRICEGSMEKLELGNIEVMKEFNYAGDIVEAVWLLVNQNLVYEAVIGSGKTYSIKDWANYCFKKMNLNWKDYVILNKEFVSEYSILVSKPDLIMGLGWQPKTSFNELVDIMMEKV